MMIIDSISGISLIFYPFINSNYHDKIEYFTEHIINKYSILDQLQFDKYNSEQQ